MTRYWCTDFEDWTAGPTPCEHCIPMEDDVIPNANEMDEPAELIGLCGRYLESLHSTLWGQAFDINDPRSRREAAEWLASQIANVYDFVEDSP